MHQLFSEVKPNTSWEKAKTSKPLVGMKALFFEVKPAVKPN